MARLRLEGKQDTEEYRKMARQAALLSDTLADQMCIRDSSGGQYP